MANGISFLLKLCDDFQVPSLSLYLLWMVAFSAVTCRPFTDISFSQIAAETCPATNFATGFCPAMFFTLSLPSDVKGSLSQELEREPGENTGTIVCQGR